MPFSAGLQVGPYRIMEQLGQGGMATVYKAYHAALDRYVAIKVLHQAFMEDPNFLARFQREARLVAKLDHPNIVPIYDYAEHEGQPGDVVSPERHPSGTTPGGQPYLVMKFIEGDTLKARLNRGPLDADEVSHIVESVGLALTYAHKQGILHRDIKPSNVILANDGQVYLADFGLARIAQSGESTLTTDMVLGTPQYISPEQAMAKKDLDEGTDIYSFGVMLYEMTVGRVPFSGDTPFSVIHDHIYTPLPLPSTVNPDIPLDLQRVLLKALSKERADRFKDVPAMVKAFKEAWTNIPTVAGIVPPAPEPELASAPASATTAPVVPPRTVSATVTAQKSKSPAPWLWIAGVFLLCLCCGVGALALRARDNVAQAEITSLPAEDTPALEAVAETETAPAVTQAAIDPSLELPELSVEKAKQQVDENPGDPKAQFLYGYTLIEDGQEQAGYEHIHQGAVLAGRNQALLLAAAKTFEDEDLWLAAAILYIEMAQNSREMPTILVNSLHQAIYRGFEEEHAPEILEYGTISRIDEALGVIAQARYALINRDDPVLVQRLIDQLNALQPGLPDTKLLKAELLIEEEKDVAAESALQSLVNARGTPAWIHDYAEELIDIVE
jgi:serine/threonine protein kinase